MKRGREERVAEWNKMIREKREYYFVVKYQNLEGVGITGAFYFVGDCLSRMFMERAEREYVKMQAKRPGSEVDDDGCTIVFVKELEWDGLEKVVGCVKGKEKKEEQGESK